MIWNILDPRFEPGHLGYIPGFLSEDDERPAREQLDANYQHGGGYNPMPQWKLLDQASMKIQYPGDPPLKPVAMTVLRDEMIFVYPTAQVLILQPDGAFIVARMD